jgi:hypothetical protein
MFNFCFTSIFQIVYGDDVYTDDDNDCELWSLCGFYDDRQCVGHVNCVISALCKVSV